MPLRESSRPPQTDVRFSPGAAAGWALACLLVQGVAAGLLRPRGSTGPVDFVAFGAVALLTLLVVLFGVVRVHGPDASLREVVGLEASSGLLPPAVPRAVMLAHHVAVAVACVVAGVALVSIDRGLDAFWAARDGAFRDELAHLFELIEAPTSRARVARLFALGLAEPASELAFYFGIVFGGLRRPRSRVLAASMSVLFFVLHASDLRTAPIRLLQAAPLLLGRLATGAIVAPMCATVAFGLLEVHALGGGWPAMPGGVAVWGTALALSVLALAFLVRAASRWRLGEFADRVDLRA